MTLEFRAAVLTKCAEAGMTADEIADRLDSICDDMERNEKRAFDLASLLSPVTAAAGGVLSNAPMVAWAAPPLLGAAAGYGLAKATDIDDTTVAEIQKQEQIDELRNQRELLARKRRMYAQR